MITQDRLKELVSYDPDTGVFVWLKDNGKNAKQGSTAGRINFYGYSVICIDGQTYLAHRLAWMYCFGNFPEMNIDHLNGDRNDNRVSNLRDVSQDVNCQNHRKQNGDKPVMIGVSFDKATKKFKSQIMHKGKNLHLGRFRTEAEAHDAYISAKRKFHAGCTI